MEVAELSYRIESGDTLSELARKYKTTVSALAKANGITNPNLIVAGAGLKIPGRGRTDSFAARGAGPNDAARLGRSDGTEGVGLPTGPVGSGGNRSIAEAGRRAALSMGGYTSRGLCATGVSRALATQGISVSGNGNQIDNNLPKDKFRQVNMSLEEALKIPGLVLTWEATSTRKGRIYGHTAITAGDGHTSYSDFIEQNTTNNGRTGFKVFVPI
jgi:hypothetical protein